MSRRAPGTGRTGRTGRTDTGRTDAGHTVRLALAGAVAARAGLAGAAALTARPAGAAWRRTNFAGRPVSLLGGPVLTAAATVTAAAGAPAGYRAAAAVVGTVSGAVGGYDDLAGARPEQAGDKGLAGHLRALRSGRVSAGAVKVVGIGACSLAAALLVPRRRGAAGLADAVLTSGLVAGTANLLNLLDLRPGRALKAVVLLAVAGLRGPVGAAVAGPLGAAAALLPADLAERVMLGDCGANAAGALLGLRLAALRGRGTRAAVLVAVVALNLASEKVSFTRVIEATPGLRQLDRLGRRPA